MPTTGIGMVNDFDIYYYRDNRESLKQLDPSERAELMETPAPNQITKRVHRSERGIEIHLATKR